MRARFNLLPHRELEQRWYRRVLGRQLLMVFIAALGTVWLVEIAYQLRVGYLEGYNGELTSAIGKILPDLRASKAVLEQRDSMLEKQRVLEKLDARRATSVLIMGDLAQALPQGVYLIRVEEDGEKFKLEGRAVDNMAVAHFFDAIVKSKRLQNLVLEEIRALDNDQPAPYQFILNGQVQLIGMDDVSPSGRQP